MHLLSQVVTQVTLRTKMKETAHFILIEQKVNSWNILGIYPMIKGILNALQYCGNSDF